MSKVLSIIYVITIMTVELDMIQTAGIGALALLVGMWLTRRVGFLQRFCVPSPVSGGLIFSLLTLSCYSFLDITFTFDGTLKEIFMLAFFTSVGFQSDLKVVRKGGKTLLFMLILLVVIISLQNLLPIIISRVIGVSPLVGMAAGSISMAGGHGTAGGFASVMEQMGLSGAATISMAAATFGLIAGSTIGGPLAEKLITRWSLSQPVEQPETLDPAMAGMESEEASPKGRMSRLSTNEIEYQRYAKASYWIIVVMALGTIASMALSSTGLSFPTYFGALICAAIVRNVIEATPYRQKFDLDKVVSVGNICLSMFLGMAMISLKLWELAALALPLLTILASQVVMIALFCYFIAFKVLGKDYDAAVLVAGICGFGLGATPNAMANMSAVCYKYRYSVKPFLIVPIVGAMFVDIMNTGIITIFLNWINR